MFWLSWLTTVTSVKCLLRDHHLPWKVRLYCCYIPLTSFMFNSYHFSSTTTAIDGSVKQPCSENVKCLGMEEWKTWPFLSPLQSAPGAGGGQRCLLGPGMTWGSWNRLWPLLAMQQRWLEPGCLADATACMQWLAGLLYLQHWPNANSLVPSGPLTRMDLETAVFSPFL